MILARSVAFRGGGRNQGNEKLAGVPGYFGNRILTRSTGQYIGI
ncbi:MAG: hypothetical protein ACTIKD_06195 [Sphingobacteriaceae bacterium]